MMIILTDGDYIRSRICSCLFITLNPYHRCEDLISARDCQGLMGQ